MFYCIIIQCETVDPLKVKAIYTNEGNTITSTISFNEDGHLIDFISNDRYYSADGKRYLNFPWSTPVRKYSNVNGRQVPACAEAIWHRPEKEYVYAKFNLIEIEYNCIEYR